jgi:transcriptional regulator with XRE-family HTH domain
MKENIIDYIVKNKGLKQKDIAKKLGVTPGQVTKWKNGEHISQIRQDELNKLAGIPKDNLNDWGQFFYYTDKDQEWPVFSILDLEDYKVEGILDDLSDLGIQIPEKAPSIKDLENYFAFGAGEVSKSNCDDSIDYNLTFHAFISDLFDSWGAVITWCDIYLKYKDDDLQDLRWEIQDAAFNIAFLSTSESLFEQVGGNVEELALHKNKTKRKATDLIARYCEELMAIGFPINTDYFKLIALPSGDLSNEVEMVVWDRPYSDEGESIMKYLPYADRNLLETHKYHIRLLESLNRKIDTLLSEEDKQKFRDDPNTLME